MKQTTIDDYIDEVQKEFNSLTKEEIRLILTHATRFFYEACLDGCDVMLSNRKMGLLYCGKAFISGLDFEKYWFVKYIRKHRLLWKQRMPDYNGKYYMGLTEEEFQENKDKLFGDTPTIIKLSRPMMLSKIKEEVFAYRSNRHLFSLDIEDEREFTITVDQLNSKDLCYIGKITADMKIEPVKK